MSKLAGALAALSLTAGALFVGQPAQAQPAWPTKPIRIIVPFVPGSFTDVSARVIAAELTGPLGQQVVVENRGGAGGTIGAAAAAKSPADGYTLLLTDNSYAMAAGLYPDLPFDPIKDMVQISFIAESPSILVARSGLGVKTLRELVELAKSRPRELTFGSGGQGSSAHLATELFLSVTGAEMTHVPFRGVAAAIAEVVAGRLDMSIASLASGMAQVKAGTVTGIAVSGDTRSPLLPQVPTFKDAGVPAYDMSYWWGIAAPAGTPADVVARLNREIAAAAQRPAVKDAFLAAGAEPRTSSPQELARHVESDIRTWKAVIARAGVKVE